jgi:RND family efflux transporter MFP subunit
MNAQPDYLSSPRLGHEAAVVIETEKSTAVNNPHPPKAPPHSSKPPRLGRLLFLVAVIFGVALLIGLIPRLRERTRVAEETRDLATPTVAVVNPAPAKAAAPLVLSGELKAYIEASIYARANGYVRKWLVDLGAHVEAGQLLAELDTPEIDRQLSQARAELTQAEAARDLAETTAKRWKEMLFAKTVSSQEADEKFSDLELKKATVEAAKANVGRLTELVGFAHVTAPFAGTITARRLDVGQLVTAGSGQELYHLSETDKLRVFVHVPQNYARSTQVGQIADLALPEDPDKKYPARVVRTAGALDPATRTLLVEMEVDNSHNQILADSYAEVWLKDSRPDAAMTLPASAIIFRAEGPQVAVVVNNHLVLHKITIGRDFGSLVEILGGIEATDKVVTNPADSFADGIEVRVVEKPTTPDPAAKHYG